MSVILASAVRSYLGTPRNRAVCPNALASTIASDAHKVGLFCKDMLSRRPFQGEGLARSTPRNRRKCVRGEVPTLFIHGFAGRANGWAKMKGYLEQKGAKNLFVLNLSNPVTGSVASHARQVAHKVEEVLRESGRKKVNLVGHSMGGVVAREYALKMAPAKVRKIITLGSPLSGANPVVELGAPFLKAAEELKPGSKLLKEHRALSRASAVAQYHLAAREDIVVPGRSALQGGGKPRATNTVAGSHNGLLSSKAAANWVHDKLYA